MIKNYVVTATLITRYSKNITFDSSNTELWYAYDEAAAKDQLKWSDLDRQRQEIILFSFQDDLQDISIDPESDPDVEEDCVDWDEELYIEEL